MVFALAGYLIPPPVIYLKIEIAFAVNGDNIRIPIAEVLLCAAASNLTRSKKQRDWTPRNTILLPPFLKEAAILQRDSDTDELLKIFARSIMEWAKGEENTREADDKNDKDSVITIKAEDDKTAKPGKANQATAETLTTIAYNYDDVLDFLQDIAVKSPRVIAAPLSLCAYKRARVWFRRWTDVKLPTPPNTTPQYHMGLMFVLTEVVNRLHTAKALCPVVAAQREVEKETKGWDCLPPMAQRVILAASATTGISIPTSPTPTIHCFLNSRNTTALQANCSLTYAGNNIYLPTSFCQALLQGHILAIPDPDVPAGLSPLLTPTSFTEPANAQKRAM